MSIYLVIELNKKNIKIIKLVYLEFGLEFIFICLADKINKFNN